MSIEDAVPVGRPADFPEGELREVKVDRDYVCVLRLDGKLHALSNVCTHAGAPMSEGYIEGGNVICAYHRWCFDPNTGQEQYNGGPLDVYVIHENADQVSIEPRSREDSRPAHLRFVSRID